MMKRLLVALLSFSLFCLIAAAGPMAASTFPDSDGDTVRDADDICPGTVLPEGFDRLIANHYGDIDGDGVFETLDKPLDPVTDSAWTLQDTYGCSCEQILSFKPGNNKGEEKFGCTEASLEVFASRSGWSGALFPLTWWNINWPYRQPINLSVSSGATDAGYQVKLIMDSSTVPSGWNWTNECVDGDSTRARFVSPAGADLDFWVQSCSGAEETMTVWVEVDQAITTDDYTIYAYFGNYEAGARSDGDATFDLFEDCEDNDVSDWGADGDSTVACSAQAKKSGDYGMLFTGNDDSWQPGYKIVYKTFTPQTSGLRKVYLSWYDPKIGQPAGNDYKYIFMADGPVLYQPVGGDFNQMGWNFDEQNSYITWFSELYTDPYSPLSWYDTEILVDIDQPGMQVDMNGGSIARDVTPGDVWTELSAIVVHIEKWFDDTTAFYMDDLFMTKYHDPEPTATFGAMQSL